MLVAQWFEEHQFLECLIQIVCGTYVPEEQASLESHEKADHEPSEKTEAAEERKPDTGAGETQGLFVVCSFGWVQLLFVTV